MNEFEIIKNYFQKITKNNPSALRLNDDVFFDKKNKIILSIDTYNEGIHYLNFKELLDLFVSLEKYFLINLNSCIRRSNLL